MVVACEREAVPFSIYCDLLLGAVGNFRTVVLESVSWWLLSMLAVYIGTVVKELVEDILRLIGVLGANVEM